MQGYPTKKAVSEPQGFREEFSDFNLKVEGNAEIISVVRKSLYFALFGV
jgi:hypothetical protein